MQYRNQINTKMENDEVCHKTFDIPSRCEPGPTHTYFKIIPNCMQFFFIADFEEQFNQHADE